MNKQVNKERGRPSDYTDLQLKEIALEVKNKYKGQKITYSLLEKETNIGRNTWSRRIANTIDELNKPVIRSLGLSDNDEIYFPNIEQLFDICGNNKNKLLSELYSVETTFYDLYNLAKSSKDELDKLKDIRSELINKQDEIEQLKKQVAHYQKLYNDLVLSSAIPHLREEKKLKHNIIEFDGNNKLHTNLENVKEHFPKIKEENNTDYNMIKQTENLSKLNKKFDKIF